MTTHSVFDTVLGKAVTGPLAKKGVQLKQANVVTTEWGAWKKAHPETTVLIEELALGRDFDFRNNRDADGPIFPIGGVDPRLPVHKDIVGIVTASGKPVAFQRSKANVALKRGDDIRFENLRLKLDRSGIKASDENGTISAVNKPFGSPGRSFITIQRFDRNRKNLHGAANPLALYRGTRGERCDEQCGTGTEHGTRQISGLYGRGEIPRLGPEQSGTDPPDGVG
ncbi:MAG: DUF3179 domain-containing (seleno)protein [Pseudomonadota bacterium]|nr:DUF3179 domain-containing (seleno)protein [Pseudomonadota bacterium]